MSLTKHKIPVESLANAIRLNSEIRGMLLDKSQNHYLL